MRMPIVPTAQYHPYIKWPAPAGIRPRAALPWRVLDLCKAYQFPTAAPGGGVIGIVELAGGWTQSDLDTFSQLNGLPPITAEDVSADGTNNHSNPDPGADGEVALDIQVAAAAYFFATGKMPTVKVIWANDIAPAVRAAADAGCDVCSISWGADEVRWAQIPGSAQDMETAANQATDMGCIVFAASGDNSSSDGDPGANVDLPSACPHVVGCGGTTKTQFSEVVWGNGRADGEGTGGGYSNIFPVQSWQLGVPPGPGRMVPDVAANADPNTGYLIVVHGQEVQVGGTSAVAPLYAGLFAAFDKGRGFVAPTLYQHPQAFVDITQGSNGSYSATIGPDPCTGLGVPNGTALAALFSGPSQSPCAKTARQTCGGVGPSVVSIQTFEAMHQFPGLASAQHHQVLRVSPAEFVVTGVTQATPDSITLHLEGTIGAIPYNLDLIFALNLPNSQLVVSLHVTQPIPYDGSWTFKLHGLSAGATSTVQPMQPTASLVAASLPHLGGAIGCIVRCVGPQIIGIILECLPSLITGKQAFFTCLIQNAQSAMPNIVQCIQQCK
jgi:kumamolisin